MCHRLAIAAPRSLIFSSGFLRLCPLQRRASPHAPGPKKNTNNNPPALRRALQHPPRACQPAVSHFRVGCSDTLEVSKAPRTAVGCSVAGRRLCLTTAQQRRLDKTLHVLVGLADQVTCC